LKRSSATLKGREALLKQRLREAYKSSGANYLELLLAARSMSDFINRTYFFEKITARDAALIGEIKRALHQVKNKREAVSSRTTEIKQLAKVIVQEKQKIAETAEEKKAISQKLRQREAEFEKKIAELEEDSRKLESLIQKKMGERGKAGIVSKGTGTFIWPLKGRITSRFGEVRRWGLQHRHTGLDIAAPHGTPIKAADSGEVIFSGWWGGYGKAIVIDHGRGLATVYAHMSRLYASEGTKVAQGQTIGLEGSTGYSTGPHLHFEVRRNGVPQNPIKYLP
jgi:murein DD-endopeptidase MepM/ murein hydrolase activator NlpD